MTFLFKKNQQDSEMNAEYVEEDARLELLRESLRKVLRNTTDEWSPEEKEAYESATVEEIDEITEEISEEAEFKAAEIVTDIDEDNTEDNEESTTAEEIAEETEEAPSPVDEETQFHAENGGEDPNLDYILGPNPDDGPITPLPEGWDKDDPEGEGFEAPQILEENAQAIINAIGNVKDKANEVARHRLMGIIAEVFKLDIVDESDILKSMLEASELKKLLSYILADLKIEVVSTVIQPSLKVDSHSLAFKPKVEYSLRDYEKGVVQALSTISKNKERVEGYESLVSRVKTTELNLQSERSNLARVTKELETEKETKAKAIQPKPVVPIQFVVGWEEDKKIFFFSAKKDAKPNKEGEYPTRTLDKTKFVSKAVKFTDRALADKQLERMRKHSNNLDFEVDSKTINLYRILIEKV